MPGAHPRSQSLGLSDRLLSPAVVGWEHSLEKSVYDWGWGIAQLHDYVSNGKPRCWKCGRSFRQCCLRDKSGREESDSSRRCCRRLSHQGDEVQMKNLDLRESSLAEDVWSRSKFGIQRLRVSLCWTLNCFIGCSGVCQWYTLLGGGE